MLFHYTILLFSPNITLHDIPRSGLCLLFLTVYCNTSRPTHIWFSPLRFQTHSQYTLWRKWGRKGVVANHSRLSKDLYYKSRFYFHLQHRHLCACQRQLGWLVFLLAYYFSLIKCVSLTSRPTTTYPPNSWLYYIKENWERMARDRVPHWINLSIYRRWGVGV